MKTVKVYEVETRKKSYLAVGTSIKDVKEYIKENKKDLDLSFDMSGFYTVSLNKDILVNSYEFYDEYIDIVNLTDKRQSNITADFITIEAENKLIQDKSLKI